MYNISLKLGHQTTHCCKYATKAISSNILWQLENAHRTNILWTQVFKFCKNFITTYIIKESINNRSVQTEPKLNQTCSELVRFKPVHQQFDFEDHKWFQFGRVLFFDSVNWFGPYQTHFNLKNISPIDFIMSRPQPVQTSPKERKV